MFNKNKLDMSPDERKRLRKKEKRLTDLESFLDFVTRNLTIRDDFNNGRDCKTKK